MHFQHPELLYALILLIIPLIVHLFRLRKFQKEDFTNVKFLKKVIQETRKSSRLKKFLILITRLCLLSCLIFAFAQPFIPASEKALGDSQTLIYLDNSFSMQARSGESTLLQRALNPLLENLDAENKFSIFTNSKEYFSRNTTSLKEEIQNIDFTDSRRSAREILLKAENYFKEYPEAEKDLVIISDFQSVFDFTSEISSDNFELHFVQLKPENLNNASIDTAYLSNSTPESITLNIRTSAKSNLKEPVTISAYDGEQLLGRNTVQLDENRVADISFRLQNNRISNGRIEIEDNGLKYDNNLFFNINEKTPVRVVIISGREINFLERIYSSPEFETISFQPNQIDFNRLNSANLVILNEIEKLPSSLTNNLSTVKNNGATVIVIPAVNAEGYEQLLTKFGFSAFTQLTETEKLITGISFDHPLLENVFEGRIDNFEYPKVLTSYNLNTRDAILEYQDRSAFLAETDGVYVFTAALNEENSNFKNSPLIVPVLYQIGLQALKNNQLFYATNEENQIDIPVQLGKDEVLHLIKDETDIIPQQQNFSNRVEINTGNLALEAGN
ncbi:MAG: BatA and WFA domain-containing protein [Gramella sp.]|nr:BatA and WFA domain-containing protein [Christiangramia sp.]